MAASAIFGLLRPYEIHNPLREPHGWRISYQLGLDDEANSQFADGYATGSSAGRGVAVGDLPTSSASAVQLVPE